MKKSLLFAVIIGVLGVGVLSAQGFGGGMRGGGKMMMRGNATNADMPCYGQRMGGNTPCFANGSNASCGCGMGMMGARMGGGMGGMMFLNRVNLSVEQRAQIAALQNELQTKMQPLFEKYPMGSCFVEGSFDKERFISDRKAFANSMIELRGEYFEKIYNILTEEQKKQITDMISQ